MEGLTLRPESHISALKNSSLHAYPLGFRARFRAVLQDNLGRDFAPARVPLDFILNRLDVVEFSSIDDNSSLTIRPIKQGYAILKVCVKNLPHICDYLHLRGDYAIIPHHPHIHVGSQVQFGLYLIEESGEWASGNEAVLRVNPSTGRGTASGVGQTTISHRISGLGETTMDVVVHQVDHIVIGQFSNDVITNALTSSHYSVSVQFFHSQGVASFTPLSSDTGHIQQFNVSCHCFTTSGDSVLDQTLPPFSITPKFYSSTNEYYCVLTPSTDPQAQTSWAAHTDFSFQLSLYATVTQEGGYQFSSEHKAILVTPAFYVTEVFVTLSPVNQKVSVEILANEKHAPHLQTESDGELLSSHVHLSGDSLVLVISLVKIDTQSFTTHVTLTSSLTGQISTVSIFYNNSLSAMPGSTRPVSEKNDFLGENIIGIFVGILLGMAAILTFLACQGNFPVSGGWTLAQGGFQKGLPPVPSPGNFSPAHTSFQRSPHSSPMPSRHSTTVLPSHGSPLTSPGSSFRSRSSINLYSQSVK